MIERTRDRFLPHLFFYRASEPRCWIRCRGIGRKLIVSKDRAAVSLWGRVHHCHDVPHDEEHDRGDQQHHQHEPQNTDLPRRHMSVRAALSTFTSCREGNSSEPSDDLAGWMMRKLTENGGAQPIDHSPSAYTESFIISPRPVTTYYNSTGRLSCGSLSISLARFLDLILAAVLIDIAVTSILAHRPRREEYRPCLHPTNPSARSRTSTSWAP